MLSKLIQVPHGDFPMDTDRAYPSCPLRPQLQIDRPKRYPRCDLTYHQETWVRLLLAPSRRAYQAVKLLCQESAATWIVWIPGYGEAVIDRSQFYC